MYHRSMSSRINSAWDVCGGDACIRNTRIPVWLIVQARRLGTTETDLLHAYPALTTQDLADAWAYYVANREEIERQIGDNEMA
jgi:uncharacterized protein (DUF433 family)